MNIIMNKVLSSGEIAKLYERGQRNFNGIKSTGQDFHNFNLKGASFRKADLSWSHFDNADLSDCDFSEANLTWSGIRMVNLKNTKFVKANVSYCDFDGSTFDKTDFSNSDLTASLLFNVNLGAAKLQGANMTWVATHLSQLSDEGLQFVLEQLKRMGRAIPPDLLAHVQLIAVKLHEKKRRLENLKAGYTKAATPDESFAYKSKIEDLEKEIGGLYTSFQTFYTQAMEYGTGRKRGIEEGPKYK